MIRKNRENVVQPIPNLVCMTLLIWYIGDKNCVEISTSQLRRQNAIHTLLMPLNDSRHDFAVSYYASDNVVAIVRG